MQFKVAVAQFSIQQFAPEENLRKAERFMQAAVAAQAQIVVFPEDFVTGPLSGNEVYVDYERRYVKHFHQLARQNNINLVPGSVIEGDANGWFNTSYSIHKPGAISR